MKKRKWTIPDFGLDRHFDILPELGFGIVLSVRGTAIRAHLAWRGVGWWTGRYLTIRTIQPTPSLPLKEREKIFLSALFFKRHHSAADLRGDLLWQPTP